MTPELGQNQHVRGVVFYDAECGVCSRGVARWGRHFTRRGFRWQPLQTPGAAAQLGVSEAVLREEMRLALPDGSVLTGAAAWAALMRSVWWLSPLGWVLALPGVRSLARLGYRWLARHRHCLSRVCP